jgi:acetolactate synthase-1/2/3 large subunit
MNSLPDVVAVAETYGHFGVRITDRDQVAVQLKDFLKIKDRLVFVDVQVDPEEHVYSVQRKDGSVRDMCLSKAESTELS